MRCRLERDYRFEAAHSLPHVGPDHPCRRVHGHSYHVRVVVEGPVDETLGWVIDFADIDSVVRPVIDRLDHQMLNEIEGLKNPTSEILSRWLWRHIAGELPALTELSVSETPSSRCVYRGQ